MLLSCCTRHKLTSVGRFFWEHNVFVLQGLKAIDTLTRTKDLHKL